MSPPLQITEDTPPDMLAGSMDLCVMLPNGHTVKMSVERSTPMMDLLVQVTTANKISPAGHMIQALGERGVMPYKPSTPIGALDTWTIHIVPKNQAGQTANRKVPFKPVNQPFEKTFRLQVHLPRNQLYVTRISPKTKLSDILIQVCNEKNLDSSKYSLRHPVNLDQVLNLSYCLADYKLQEVALVSNRSRPLGASSVDIMSLQQTDNAGYNFNMTRNNRSCDGSMSSGSIGGRSLSPTRSDGSSASPPPVVPPNRPIRKRRPAPKPPVAVNNNNNNNNINNSSNKINSIDNNSNKCEQMQSSSQGPQGTVICHSRNSSDSSGYHEASVLSESPESNSLPDSLPRRSKLPSANVTESNTSKVATNLSRSLSNLTAAGSNVTPSMKSHSISTTSLVSITGRKKKAAPLPPLLKPKMSSVSEETPKQRTPSVSSTASSSTTLEENDHNIPRKSSTLPASIRVAQPSSKTEPVEPDSQQSSNLVNETPNSSLDRLQEPVEQPKPKPRTVFQTVSVASDVCTKPVGDGSQPTKTSVNTTLPRKSRKSYPAPAPKPKNSVTNESSSIVTSENSTKNDSSQNQIVSGNSVIENNIERKSDVLNERRVDRVKSADDSFSNNKSQETETSSDFDTESLHSSASSVFIKTDSSEKETLLKKLKEFPSGTNLNHKTDNSNKGRNFSVGNIEDVPDFLSDSSHLGRWKNMECLPEACATLNACGTGQCSESELEDEKKVDSNSDLRLDDDEIDRIFHNATRDHASLESGVGEESPLSLLSLPSPPSSLTNQPELAVVNNNNDSLDWEYKLPAPPTFRDETNSPTVTEFDTVTIGNLTEVFGPESIVQTENKKKINKDEPDLVNSQSINSKNTSEPNQINKEKTELVVSKPTENKNKLVEKSQMDILSEDSIKIKTLGHVFAANDSTKPDLLKHSLVDEKPQSPTEVEKSAVINELSSVITERLNKPEARLVEMENSVKTRNSSDVKQTSALDNFVITTYKESKPVEVFEDDSIKSSNGERRDSSRDEAMFRAPKSVPRRFEPNLARRSSFSSDDKPYNNITVKRSVSHVSLLAGNVARSPYRSHLARSNGALTETSRLSEETEKIGSRLRKTASEINISQGIGDSKLGDWRTGDTVGLQSLQVLRSILPQLSHSQSCTESERTENLETINNDRVTSVSDKKFESKLSDHKEEESSNDSSTTSKRYSYSGPPTINLTTWSERPKRQVSIKMDRDYCFGFGKLKSNSLDETETKDSTKSNETTNGFSTMVTQHSNSRLDEKPDIVKHSNDLSHVPIVRAVELKKPYSTNNIDTTDFNRCGFYNGRSYENLNNIENDSRPHSVHQSSFGSTVSIASKSSSNIKLNSEPINEERISSVTSLAKRFGQAKVRPSSCYLYGSSSNNHNTQEKQEDKNEEIFVKSTNTSRVFLNASDNKKFTSIVGINGVENNSNTDSVNNNYNNKTEIKIVQRPQLQTSKVIIGGDNNNYINNKAVGFKVNGSMSINNNSNNINNHKAESNSSSSDVRAQSKISSGGYLDETVKVASFRNNVSNINYNNTNKLSHNPSLKQQTTFMPVVKGFRKPENKTIMNEQLTGNNNNNSAGGGIPPPPPVMPVLKPIGERRQIKTLPLPQADPRDQLLASIRNFGGANNLRKITSK